MLFLLENKYKALFDFLVLALVLLLVGYLIFLKIS